MYRNDTEQRKKQVVTDHPLQRENQSLDTAKARFFP